MSTNQVVWERIIAAVQQPVDPFSFNMAKRLKSLSGHSLLGGLPAPWFNPVVRVLIVGCGYVGLPLGAALVKQGHDVYGVRRSAGAEADLTAAGIKPLVADITRREDLARLPGPFDSVVNCVSSTKGGVDEYRRVYLDGTRNLIEWLSTAP